MKARLTLRGMIKRGVVTASEEDSGRGIALLMAKKNIGAVVIMRDKIIAGIVSERDIVRRVCAQGKDPGRVKAKDFMTADVITIDAQEGSETIFKTLCTLKFRHLPITKGGFLAGIASQRDILYGPEPAE